MKIYIAGPMRGYLDYNFPAFHEAAKVLREEGWDVINPAELDEEAGFDTSRDRTTLTKEELEEFIIRDIHLVISCDAICLLSGYQMSKGVDVELAVARYCSLPVYYIDKFGKIVR